MNSVKPKFHYADLVICVHDFPCGEVSVKVGAMEFGLYYTSQNMK